MDEEEKIEANKGKLYKKLYNIREEASGLNQSGENEVDQYCYSTEQDVLDAISTSLTKHKIMIVPEARTAKRLDNIIDVAMEYTIVDIDTGYSITKKWIGSGFDNADKGIYKAYTGANKYFLMKLFGLVAGNDDPEKEVIAKKSKVKTVEQVLASIEKIDTKDKVDKLRKSINSNTLYNKNQQNVILRAIEEKEKTL